MYSVRNSMLKRPAMPHANARSATWMLQEFRLVSMLPAGGVTGQRVTDTYAEWVKIIPCIMVARLFVEELTSVEQTHGSSWAITRNPSNCNRPTGCQRRRRRRLYAAGGGCAPYGGAA